MDAQEMRALLDRRDELLTEASTMRRNADPKARYAAFGAGHLPIAVSPIVAASSMAVADALESEAENIANRLGVEHEAPTAPAPQTDDKGEMAEVLREKMLDIFRWDRRDIPHDTQ